MSRTKRKRPHSPYSWFRSPKTFNMLLAEVKAAQEIEEAGFDVPNRLSKRSNKGSGEIVTAWDDLTISALRELDHHV